MLTVLTYRHDVLPQIVDFISFFLTTEYPATVGNLFLRIRRSLKKDARLNQEQ